MTDDEHDDEHDDDDLLDQLGALEREYDERFPHEWEDVVRGRRSVEEVAAVRRAAGDDPEELDALVAMLAVGSDEERMAERERWVDRLAAARTEHHPDAGEAASDRGDDAHANEDGGATVISLAERRRGAATWVTAGLGVLAAAALALWLVPRDHDGQLPVDGGASALPGFGLVVRNETLHDVRSSDVDPTDPTKVPRYRADTRVHWVVRPERSVASSLGLRVLAEAVGPGVEPSRRLLDPGPATVSERGVIELQGRFGDMLGLPPGRWSLRLLVGDPPPQDLAAFDHGGAFIVVEPAYVIDVVE
ncbi:hypothetical protein [Paraliomyxa miuraensis]|uniref:hypothetical protein n=1 Tax=Paraliomyxa miuraensis TaxID=376150 RepID=UPI00225B00F1|nr:hypothetical protein [Paraliomyxa miuraensis]MCX4241258.1 hypothetical protein [Paraliomyxa miuraensis]